MRNTSVVLAIALQLNPQLRAACDELPKKPSLVIGGQLNDRICIDLSKIGKTGKVRVFVEEAYLQRFPQQLVEELGGTEPAWCSVKRRTWRSLLRLTGLDIRDPSQWFAGNVLTPGETYTIGIQREGFDPLTGQPTCVSSYGHVQPFRIIAVNEAQRPGPRATRPRVTDDIPPQVRAMLHTRGDALVYAGDVRELRVTAMEDQEGLLVFWLGDGRELEIEKLRHRPGPLGDPGLVGWVLIVCATVIVAGLLFVIYLLRRSFQYANLLAEPANDPRLVMRAILDHRFGVLIVFVLVSSISFEWPAKGLNAIFGEVKGRCPALLDNVKAVFLSKPVSVWSELRTALTAALDRDEA